MATTAPTAPERTTIRIAEPPYGSSEAPGFLRNAAVFLLIGVILYGALYAGSEWLVYRHALRNRFYVVQTAPLANYDYVILGASHAAVFDYRDMNARLEEMTGANILNLATVGGGILINQLLLDYFFQEHTTDTVVYILDSFALYSREWNEARLEDASLFTRAPWDPALAGLLLRSPADLSVALDYITGFSKINNPDRFGPDLFEAEGSTFDRVYRPIAQLDRQRITYLYPSDTDAESLTNSPYLASFVELMEEVEGRGGRFVVVRPPIRDEMHEMLPNESFFDATIRDVVERNGAELYDFSGVNNDPDFFYDSDHLNQAGAIRFYEDYLGPLFSMH